MMAFFEADVIITEGDRYPPIQSVLTDASGTPLDLSQWSTAGRFILASSTGVSPSINESVVTTSTVGVVTYNWSTAALGLDAGHYWGEFKIYDATGKRLTVPNGGYLTVEIQPGLSTA